MPAGMVRPRASQVAPLSAEAIATYLRRPGWRLTEHGRLDLDVTTGPCARCQTPHRRYGPQGRPLCDHCDTEGRRDGQRQHPRLSLVRPTAT